MKKALIVNGLPVQAFFPDETVQAVFLPLLAHLEEMQKAKGHRLLVALAAPPGAGKSTLALFLEALCPSLQAVQMDGFHYPQSYLNSHPYRKNGKITSLAAVKGAPQSFNVSHLREKLSALRQGDTLFPVYDRTTHDIVEEVLPVTAPIVLMEGNWLLLDRPKWERLPFDFTVFLSAEEEMLCPRILSRRIAGGKTAEEARQLVDSIDRPNIALCCGHHRKPDLSMTLHEGNRITIDKE